MILHSDRCSQFTSPAFRKVLAQYGAVQSMSGTGRCYGNARMESFFATLKKEKLYRIRTERMPMAQVKSIVFRYIMTYYNRQRIYTANPGGLPPRHVPSGRQRSGRISCRFWVFTFCTVLDFSTI